MTTMDAIVAKQERLVEKQALNSAERKELNRLRKIVGEQGAQTQMEECEDLRTQVSLLEAARDALSDQLEEERKHVTLMPSSIAFSWDELLQVVSTSAGPWEGKTVGVKVPNEVHERMGKQVARYGASSLKQIALSCIRVGLSCLEQVSQSEDQDGQQIQRSA